MFDWIELALGTPAHRGVPIRKSELVGYIKKANNGGFPGGNDLYRSMYKYPRKAINEKKFKSKDYFGERDIDWIVLDVDKGRNTDEYTYDVLQEVLSLLKSFKLTEQNYTIYFSGTGYNVHLPNSLFDFKPSEHLPIEVKDTLFKMFGKMIDLSIFGHVSLYRVPFTMNHKSSLFKVPIFESDLNKMNVEQILKYAEIPNHKAVAPKGNGELNSKKITRKAKPLAKIQYHAKVTEPNTEATCIQKIYNRGPEKGTRHHALLRMASHYRRKGFPSNAAKAALLDWNNGELNEADVNKTVEGVYNRGYQYGCQDWMLKEVCEPICRYYKDKSYLNTIKTVDDMQSELEKYVMEDFTGRVLHLGALLGLKSGVNLYPGELMSIYGPTGCNKTTFAQNLALGYCAATDSVIERFQMDTLFLSLELSSAEMQKRNLAIVTNSTTQEVIRDISINRNNLKNSMYYKCKHLLSHIKVLTLSPTIDGIIENVKQFKPKLLIIDYLDLIGSGKRSEYERLNDVCHKLRNLATNEGIIIIQLAINIGST